jgi:phosphopentomutase
VSRYRRVLVIVADSAGAGELPDAASYGDAGANTLLHTAQAAGGLRLPNLQRLGLGSILQLPGVPPAARPAGFYGQMAERSPGKDTTTGHWEMMGLVLDRPFPTFPRGFPPEIVEPFVQATGREVLGNKTASGTAIIEELGEEHLRTGKWILYTSADSVFQLAAHEEKIPLEELYAACRTARQLLDRYRVGRVIARPFVGSPGSFQRTYNRQDFSLEPTGPTVLEALHRAGVPVVGVGKIHDIFAGRDIDRSLHTEGNRDGLQKTAALLGEIENGFIFVNLVDFDMRYGHRRDPRGYARALEEMDLYLGEIQNLMRAGDLLLITADHGCDPTFAAHTDHTREYVPLLLWWPGLKEGGSLGVRGTFADLGATVAEALGVQWAGPGEGFLPQGR